MIGQTERQRRTAPRKKVTRAKKKTRNRSGRITIATIALALATAAGGFMVWNNVVSERQFSAGLDSPRSERYGEWIDKVARKRQLRARIAEEEKSK